MLCMWTYSIERTNLLLWVLSYLVVRSMMMATRQNKHETEKMGGKKIYIFVQYVLLFVIKYFNHSQCTKRMIQKLYLCVMFMHEYYLCSNELLIWRPFRLYVVTDLPLFLLSSSPPLEARRSSPVHLSYFLYFI